MRSAIGIDDDGAFAGKALENPGLNRLNDRLNGLGVVMGRQADQDVYLAHVDELAKKIIGQKCLFRQFNLRAKRLSCESVRACPTETANIPSDQIRRSRNQ